MLSWAPLENRRCVSNGVNGGQKGEGDFRFSIYDWRMSILKDFGDFGNILLYFSSLWGADRCIIWPCERFCTFET